MQASSASLLMPAATPPAGEGARAPAGPANTEKTEPRAFSAMVAEAAPEKPQSARESEAGVQQASPAADARSLEMLLSDDPGNPLPPAIAIPGKALPQADLAVPAGHTGRLLLAAGLAGADAVGKQIASRLPALATAGAATAGAASARPWASPGSAAPDAPLSLPASAAPLTEARGISAFTATAALPLAGGDAAPAAMAGIALAQSTPDIAATSRAFTAEAPVTYDLAGEVGEPEWNRALGERLMVMNDQGVRHASLRLHPQHLGPLDVMISVTRDEVSVVFQAQHGVTREAIEQAIPRLREMLSESGLNLSNANVSAQTHDQAAGGHPSDADREAVQGHSADDETPAAAEPLGPDRIARHQGLLDAYA